MLEFRLDGLQLAGKLIELVQTGVLRWLAGGLCPGDEAAGDRGQAACSLGGAPRTTDVGRG
jgi:hypothetical protein